MGLDRSAGHAFENRGVAQAYVHRPPYAPELYERLLALAPRRDRALDLGCGPGKLTHELSRTFRWVDGLDPSEEMLAVAARCDHPNISWILGSAESALLAARYDLVTAGASVHWMDHARLFPRLVRHLADDAVVAIIDGDDAHSPPWEAEWEDFMVRWFRKLGRDHQPERFRADMMTFEMWLDVAGREEFTFMHDQSVDSFIECQHSRATWSRARMSGAEDFDRELADLLEPFSDRGQLCYVVQTRLTWGRPRSTPA